MNEFHMTDALMADVFVEYCASDVVESTKSESLGSESDSTGLESESTGLGSESESTDFQFKSCRIRV